MEARPNRPLCWTVLATAGLVLPLVRAQVHGADAPALEAARQGAGGAIVAEPLREECFVLEQAADGAGGRTEVVGLVRCRRLELEDGWQLEWDVHFPDELTRVLHVERWSAAGSAMIWRELRPQSGRTLTAQWAEDGRGLLVREWGGPQRREIEAPAPGGGALPLGLLELARADAIEGGSVSTFDPLSRSFETLRLGQGREPDGTRRVELVREDGTRATTWWLDGERLVAFEWQGGGPRARRIERAEYEERLRPAPAPEPVAASR